MRTSSSRLGLAILVLSLFSVPVSAQTPPTPATPESTPGGFKNLKVLPETISDQELRAMMSGFTRALGVRCDFCHVRAGEHFTPEDFAKDDKVNKAVARDMIKMVRDINQKYLADLKHREDPPIAVECVTCHHGTPQPRTLQAVLRRSYDQGGLDSTTTRYHRLRDRYYGRATYDFGDVPLSDVGTSLAAAGKTADAESLQALNLAMNPDSPFARRQWASTAVANGFRRSAAEGANAVEAVRARYGPESFNEEMLNAVAYALLGRNETAAAIAAFQKNVKEHPQSANAYDSLGEAYVAAGDKKNAKAAYEKSLRLDPKNENAKKQLEAIRKMK